MSGILWKNSTENHKKRERMSCESRASFLCTEDVKLLSKKGNYAMLKTEDYRLAVQSLSVKGVMLCALHILIWFRLVYLS